MGGNQERVCGQKVNLKRGLSAVGGDKGQLPTIVGLYWWDGRVQGFVLRVGTERNGK